jgi:hypothetical protein
VSPRTSLSDAKDAVKSGVKETPISGAKRHYNLCKKDDKKVAKKDDKKVAKKDDKKSPKDSQLLPCLIVYSLIQKRERVVHYLSVFIIVIIYFDKL